jgi:hypothetical protein
MSNIKFNFDQPEEKRELFDFSIFVSDEEVLESMKKETKSELLDEDAQIIANITKGVLLTEENAKTYYRVAKFLYANDENKHIFENNINNIEKNINSFTLSNIEKNEQALSFHIRVAFNNRDENPFKVLRSIFLFLNDADAKDMIEEKMNGEDDLHFLIKKYYEKTSCFIYGEDE